MLVASHDGFGRVLHRHRLCHRYRPAASGRRLDRSLGSYQMNLTTRCHGVTSPVSIATRKVSIATRSFDHPPHGPPAPDIFEGTIRQRSQGAMTRTSLLTRKDSNTDTERPAFPTGVAPSSFYHEAALQNPAWRKRETSGYPGVPEMRISFLTMVLLTGVALASGCDHPHSPSEPLSPPTPQPSQQPPQPPMVPPSAPPSPPTPR
jgi:hypothetical protein